MPTDTAHLPALLEICQANGLTTHGWHKGHNDTWQRRTIINSDGRACSQYIRPCEATPTDLAAVCWEVAKWLRDEHSVNLEHYKDGKWLILKHRVPFYPDGNKDGSFTSCWLNADSEPAALVAACGEVGK